MRITLLIVFSFFLASCNGQDDKILTGANQIDSILLSVSGKKVALVANHTSLVGNRHLIDTLLSYSDNNFEIVSVFTPEHGFRGDTEAGDFVENQVDNHTGLPIISLYGQNRKPFAGQLSGVDVVIFDIQDIGVRFYTYISTLHFIMEACAENNVQLIVLDRPNPNGNYVDGPILEDEFRSFVGMHPIPVVHGLTIGELAGMINGEGWLNKGIKCDLKVIPCINYTHQMDFSLTVKPSPNLPNDHAVRMYPSMCFFEGTVVSEGRGTMTPFEVFGHPNLQGDYAFTPYSIEGMSMSPKLKDTVCFGEDLRSFYPEEAWTQINLKWLIEAYENFPDKNNFFLPYFENLAGTKTLRQQIVAGWSEEEIRKSWRPDLEKYMKMRDQYMIYP